MAWATGGRKDTTEETCEVCGDRYAVDGLCDVCYAELAMGLPTDPTSLAVLRKLDAVCRIQAAR